MDVTDMTVVEVVCAVVKPRIAIQKPRSIGSMFAILCALMGDVWCYSMVLILCYRKTRAWQNKAVAVVRYVSEVSPTPHVACKQREKLERLAVDARYRPSTSALGFTSVKRDHHDPTRFPPEVQSKLCH